MWKRLKLFVVVFSYGLKSYWESLKLKLLYRWLRIKWKIPKSVIKFSKEGLPKQRENLGGKGWDSQAAKDYLLTGSRYVISGTSLLFGKSDIKVMLQTQIPFDWYHRKYKEINGFEGYVKTQD